MTIKQLLLNYPQVPLQEREILLTHVLKTDRSFIAAFPEKELSANQIARFNKSLERRSGGEPLAYILGYKDFFNLRFFVDKRVLIPRPETEDLIEIALMLVKNIGQPTIADVGCGSGCIAISLAKTLPSPKIIATDISENALVVAAKNAQLHGVASTIEFIKTNLIEAVDEPLDLIVANLPYIPLERYKKLPVEIKDFEPKDALLSGDSEENFYRELFSQAKKKLKKNGKIVYEINGKVYTRSN